MIPTFEGFGPIVPGEGPQPARLLIVGEAPGAEETAQGRPFVGAAGQILNDILLRAGLDRAQIRIVNAVPRRPPNNRQPTTAEIQFFRQALAAEIAATAPEIIVAMGAVALYALTGLRGITKFRGMEQSYGKRVVWPTFHPAAALHGSPAVVEHIVADLRRVRERLNQVRLPQNTEVVLVTQTSELRADLRATLLQAPVIAYDVETTGLDPDDPEHRLLGGALCPRPGLAVYFVGPALCNFLGEYQARMDTAKWIAYNGMFDRRWLRRYGIELPLTFDPMVAAYVLNENRVSFRLERLAVELLGVAPYHQDTEVLLSAGRGAEIPVEALAARCGRDADYTFRLYEVFRAELMQEPGLQRIFMHIAMPTVRMLEDVVSAGLPLDLNILRERMDLIAAEEAKHLRAMEEISKMSGANFKSPRVLAEALYNRLGLPVLKRTEKAGQPSTEEAVLVALRHHSPFVDHLLEYRKCQKYGSAYYARWFTRQRGGRFRGSLGIVNWSKDRAGTRTGRLSGDLQQVPRQSDGTPAHLRVKDVVVAPPGFVLVEADLEQIEVRTRAWLSGDQALQTIFREGRDIYTEAAKSMFRRTTITQEDRQKAKVAVLGLQYNMSAHGLWEYAQSTFGVSLTPDEAAEIRRQFFAAFPQQQAYFMRREAEVRSTMQVRSPLGRIRRLPEIRSPKRDLQREAIQQAINAPDQSTANDLNLLMALEVHAWLRQTGAGRIINLVHDSVLLEVREERVPEVAVLIRQIVEHRLPEEILPRRFGVRCPVPLRVAVKAGRSWGRLEPVDTAQEA